MTEEIIDTTGFEDINFLDTKKIRFFRSETGDLRLTIEDDKSYLKVTAARAFPLSNPEHYIGIFDNRGPEVGLIHNLHDLDPESRKLVEEELRKHYFTPVILQIYRIKSEFGTIYWDVETDKGDRKFVMRNLRENLFEVSPNRYLIQDVDGCRFEIRDAELLDKKSQLQLERIL